MSDDDWYGDTDPNNTADDGTSPSDTASAADTPAEIAPGLIAGDFVNGKGLLGIRRTSDADGGSDAPGSPAPDWGPNGPADPYDVYRWMQSLGDHGIAYRIKDGKLSVYETREGPDAPTPGAYGVVDVDDYVPGQQDDQPVEWRRYPAPANVRQDLGYPVPQDIDAYRAARDYLGGDPNSAAMWARVEAAHVPVVMIADDKDRKPEHQDRFEVGAQSWPNGIVYWNPARGAQVPTSPTQGSILDSLMGRAPIQSPALLLDHEFGHADRWLRDPTGWARDIQTRTGDDWDNLEEKRDIQDVETPAAQRLDEPTRTSHRGIYVPAPTAPRRK